MSEAEGVQPVAEGDESQGAEGGSGGLYDLSAVPEDLRPQVEPLFKQFDANVTKKFQEHADYRKQWEPLEQLGVHEMDPAYLGELLQFAETHLSSEDALHAFVTEQAQQLGLSGEEEDVDPEADDPVQAELQELRDWRSQVEEREQTRAEEQAMQKANSRIDEEVKRLTGELGEIPEDDLTDVFAVAAAFEMDNPVEALEAAYRKYFEKRAAWDKDLFKRKGEQPQAPEQGGRPGTGEPPNTDRGVARQRAAERLRQNPL